MQTSPWDKKIKISRTTLKTSKIDKRYFFQFFKNCLTGGPAGLQVGEAPPGAGGQPSPTFAHLRAPSRKPRHSYNKIMEFLYKALGKPSRTFAHLRAGRPGPELLGPVQIAPGSPERSLAALASPGAVFLYFLIFKFFLFGFLMV